MSYKGPKFIVVTGGVLSGLGKGIATASIGHLLSGRLNVIPIKCDGYLNTDPGTMNPIEHGEVFVLDDGGEVDMDFGHYERFLGVTSKFSWNLTMGKVFKMILDRERRGDFLGQTVQFIPHVTDTIKECIHSIAKAERADIVLIEIGGTVGDMENELYLEAVRQLRQNVGTDNIVFVHLTYVPVPSGIEEQKSKPTQQSVKLLNERGIRPDLIIGRGPEMLTNKIKQKIALFCNIEPEAVISGADVDTVYRLPLVYEKERVTEILHKKLKIYSPPSLGRWAELVDRMMRKEGKTPIRLAICGKYVNLHDSYASILEAISHTGAHLDAACQLVWVDTTEIENGKVSLDDALSGIDAVIVPGGFGTRGIEGKIEVIRVCREKKIPFLGICYGMQLAVIEFARNVCAISEANTKEIEADGFTVKEPVVCILPEQQKIVYKGGTMRLGGHDVVIVPRTKAEQIFRAPKIRRRFRHRYEINPEYVSRLKEKGMVFCGHDPSGEIMQLMELPDHPFFMGCQFHPELTSCLDKPDELFYNLVKAALEKKRSSQKM
ncbi:MAG: CTP synthase (glutamine hydrolyzing) [Myxococcales bacterium]|nr:MAG: CTP synthase (glutamine hydrolyzing) [Myxococcales bacterium]